MVNPSSNFFNEDWDNLVILDGCRYDYLRDYQSEFREGKFDSRISPASSSLEFVRKVTEASDLRDVVWVTANPWIDEAEESIFKVVNVWTDGWNEELETVHPRVLSNEALQVVEDFPNKRIVVHFMQPHYPFIGEFGREKLPKHRSFTGDGKIAEPEGSDIWKLLRTGEVERSAVEKAYRENLELVIPYALDLVDFLIGKTVITADHGNEFGTRTWPLPIKIFGHPSGLRTEGLVKVPWIVFSTSKRREIWPGPLGEKTNDGLAKEARLKKLGYI
jgi:hypothetical protein